MLLEMLLLNELEEAVCDCFCCLLAQSHPVACIAFSQLLLRFTCVLCSSAYGFSLIVCLFVFAIIVFGVLCSSTTGCNVLCGSTSSSALSQHLVHSCNFCSVCSFLSWQCEINEVLDHDAIRRERAKLGCEVCGCLHKLASGALDCVTPLMQSPSLNDQFL